MNRQERAQFAAEIEARVLARMRRELWRPGTVVDAPTSGDPQVGVALDWANDPVGNSDVATETQQVVEYGQIVGDPPAPNERVMVRYRPGGGMDVAGTVGGSWRLLNGVIVPGSTADQNSTSAVAETAIALLTVEVDVPRPNRWVDISIAVRIGSDVAAGSTNAANGKVYREDYDANGTATTPVFVGYWFLDALRSSANSGVWVSATIADIAPEVGVCRYYATLDCSAGFTVHYNIANSTSAYLAVFDRGPAPEDVDLPA